MRHNTSLIFLAFSVMTLGGCVYHLPIQQGNIITNTDVSSFLHKGMTKDQVRTVLGDPVLVNIFSDNRIVYVYTFQWSYNRNMQSTHLIIYFSDNNRVTNFCTYKNQTVSRTHAHNP